MRPVPLSRLHCTLVKEFDEELELDFVDKFEALGGLDDLDMIANTCESDAVAAQAARLLDRLNPTEVSF